MKAEKFLNMLEEEGFDFFTGVPCSYFTPLCDLLAQRPASFHVTAVREDVALGLAAGASMAGKTPVLYMQNSGLGYSLEAFASLQMIYHIPALILMSYRGPDDQGWEEHRVMGEHTEGLLSLFRLAYGLFRGEISSSAIRKIQGYLQGQELPYFLLVTRGALQ